MGYRRYYRKQDARYRAAVRATLLEEVRASWRFLLPLAVAIAVFIYANMR